MLPFNPLELFLGIAVLILAGVSVYLWLTIDRLQQNLQRLEKTVDSAPRPAAPAAIAMAPAPAPAPSPAKAPEADVIDEGVLAAIAAAVAMIVREPHRIIAIQSDAGSQLAWSAEGRRDIYHSHRIR
jgi:hypothetical protein